MMCARSMVGVLAIAGALAGCSSSSTESKSPSIGTLAPTSNEISGWQVDAHGVTQGQLQVANSQTEATALIDGSAEPFYKAPFSAVALARQGYINGGALIEYMLWQMQSASMAADLHQSLLSNSLYSSLTWTQLSIGDGARIAGVSPNFDLHAHKGPYYLLLHTSGTGTSQQQVVDFATAAVKKLP